MYNVLAVAVVVVSRMISPILRIELITAQFWIESILHLHLHLILRIAVEHKMIKEVR